MTLSSQKIDPKNLSTQETITGGREGGKEGERERGRDDGRNENREKQMGSKHRF